MFVIFLLNARIRKKGLNKKYVKTIKVKCARNNAVNRVKMENIVIYSVVMVSKFLSENYRGIIDSSAKISFDLMIKFRKKRIIFQNSKQEFHISHLFLMNLTTFSYMHLQNILKT